MHAPTVKDILEYMNMYSNWQSGTTLAAVLFPLWLRTSQNIHNARPLAFYKQATLPFAADF